MNEKDLELLRELKRFSVMEAEYIHPGFGKPNPLRELPQVAKRIIDEIKKEEGLTYVGAYAALELVYNRLKFEANFVALPKGNQKGGMKVLKDISTCELVRELEMREGVKVVQIPHYESVNEHLNKAGILDETGTATVMFIVD